MKLRIVPVDLDEANDYVRRLHRHSKPVQGHKFAVGVVDEDGLRGVAICGRPVAPVLDDGRAAEIRRVCTDGARNACSILYGAARRALAAMGHEPIYTYTLPAEGGGEPARRRIPTRQDRRRRAGEKLAQPGGTLRAAGR